MKKLLTILLSLAMILTTGTVAFAEEGTTPTSPYPIESVEDPGNSVDINVYADIDVDENTERIGDPTYKVVVSWKMDGAIKGKKSVETCYKWNDETFAYDKVDSSDVVLTYDKDDNEDDLNQTKVSIDFENKSDAAIKATIEYVPVVDGEQQPCSMIFDPDMSDNITANFNDQHKGEGHYLGSILRDGLNERTFAAFDNYVLGLYLFGIARDAQFEGESNIDSLINWLTNSSDNKYKDKFKVLNPKNAAGLLRIAAGKGDFEAGEDNSSALGIPLPITKATFVDQAIVKLTDEGVKYVTNQTGTNVNIGHFTVTVSTYNVR